MVSSDWQPWYSPGEIVFTREQTLWVLEYLRSMLEGQWPVRPTNYTEPKVQKSPSRHAYFETPIQVGAEMCLRLRKARQDGAMCRLRYVYDESIACIAEHWRISEEMAESRIERAFDYCCGEKRKGTYWQRW